MIEGHERRSSSGGGEKKIRRIVEMKGRRMEMDGRKESLKVRRQNENIGCFFSRTRSPKTKNKIWSGFAEVN